MYVESLGTIAIGLFAVSGLLLFPGRIVIYDSDCCLAPPLWAPCEIVDSPLAIEKKVSSRDPLSSVGKQRGIKGGRERTRETPSARR